MHEVPGDVFRRSGGQLGLRCRLAEDGMKLPIEVADDGAGAEQSLIGEAFDPRRVPRSPTLASP